MDLVEIEMLLFSLIKNMAVIAVAAYLLGLKFNILPKLISQQAERKTKLFLIIFFGILSMMGTYLGIYVQEAYANIRAIGAVVGGLLGGPIVGGLAGLIGGGHRFLLGGFTAVPCAISTIMAGLIGGSIYYFRPLSKINAEEGFLLGIGIEILEMGLVLALSRPYPKAYQLVQLIALPMILSNACGIAIFISILKQSIQKEEELKAMQAYKALKIANKSLGYLRQKGLNYISAQKTAEIILNITGIAAVSITDSKQVLAHCGQGADHHQAGGDVITDATREVLADGELTAINTREEIGCPADDCPLAAAVIAPLMRGETVIGALKLYKAKPDSMTEADIELARGTAQLLSTQLHISNLEHQAQLATEAELQALQAQIRPHFLFNALNTIITFCRTDAEKARELLLKLSKFFRATLQQSCDEVTLEEELTCINQYLAIEQARFGDDLTVIKEIPEQLLDYELPSFTIQPLVENAVKHGISPKLGGGKLKIQAAVVDDCLICKVIDNGVGMTLSKQEEILTPDAEQKQCIGVNNVHQRLQKLYGTEYGLAIESEVNQGTEVTIKYPLLKRSADYNEQTKNSNC